MSSRVFNIEDRLISNKKRTRVSTESNWFEMYMEIEWVGEDSQVSLGSTRTKLMTHFITKDKYMVLT